ncbi:MAG: hypothetical protein ACXIVQ_16630 [Acidimicrobiales bacterium]
MATKGKWAQGITPRHFSWIIKDKLAVCERPGGYGHHHRKVRRQEEIIWIREQGFSRVVSLIPSPHNLHNYDELGVEWVHCPFGPHDDTGRVLELLYPQMRSMIADGGKLLLHGEELGDRLCGVAAGYLYWTGLIATGPDTISAIEQLTSRQLGPTGREIVTVAQRLRDASTS